MILKRLFDIAFSLTVLIILLPLFCIIAVWIKLDSKGPVFFRQVRVGRNRVNFRIFKFRTMYMSDDNSNLQITVSADPRVTRAGAFLRKYKVDELIQFLNVFFGQMSVVGPRPEVPYFIEKYPVDLRQKILSMRPGITDKASIEFRNESKLLDSSDDPETTYVKQILPIKIKYYSDYIDNHSFFGDIGIILKTTKLIFNFIELFTIKNEFGLTEKV